MKARVMPLFRALWADPHWQWWGRKVCLLAARVYCKVDRIEDLMEPIRIGGRRQEQIGRPYLTHREKKWIMLQGRISE